MVNFEKLFVCQLKKIEGLFQSMNRAKNYRVTLNATRFFLNATQIFLNLLKCPYLKNNKSDKRVTYMFINRNNLVYANAQDQMHNLIQINNTKHKFANNFFFFRKCYIYVYKNIKVIK